MQSIANHMWKTLAALIVCFCTVSGAPAAKTDDKGAASVRAFPYALAFRVNKFRYNDYYAMSPDGKRIAVVVVTPPDKRLQSVRFLDNGAPIDAQGGHIRVMKADGQAKPSQTAICGGRGDQWSPVWSPDGRRLAFYSDADGKARVWVMNAVDGNCRRVSDAVIRTSVFTGYQAHWSPNGRKLFVPLRPNPPLELSDSKRLTKIDENDDVQAAMTSPPQVFFSGAEQPKSDESKQTESGDDTAFFMSQYNATLASIDVESGAVTTIVDARSKPRPATLEISPSGRWMAYTSVVRRDSDISTTYVSDLSFVSTAGGPGQALASRLTMSESPVNYLELDYRWAPDRDRLVYLKDDAAWLVNFGDSGPGKPRRLAPELGKLGGVVLYFTRDGKSLLVGLDATQEGRNVVPKKIGIIPLDGGKAKTYNLPDPVRWQFLDALRANDDVLWQPRLGEIFFLERDRASAREAVFRLDLASGKLRIVNQGLHQLSHFASGGDQRYLYALYQDIATPQDVYRFSADVNDRTQMSVMNPKAEGLPTSTPVVLQVRVPLYDGTLKTVRTTLLLPKGAKRGDKAPAIVMIYSGSDFSTRATFYGGGMGNSVPNQIFTSRGYAVLMADIELSPEGERGNPLQQMVDVLLPQVYAAADQGYIDIDRLAISGQSYGGYSTASIVSMTNLFRAGIPVSGTYDLASFYGGLDKEGNSDWVRWAEKGQGRMGESPWANLQRYIDNSPFYRIDRIHTPLLIVAGDADDTCPADGARYFFVGLRRMGRPAELLVYPGEGHVISEWSVQHAVDVSRRMVAFLRKHLK